MRRSQRGLIFVAALGGVVSRSVPRASGREPPSSKVVGGKPLTLTLEHVAAMAAPSGSLRVFSGGNRQVRRKASLTLRDRGSVLRPANF
jgi:hypothetical protein